MRSQATTHGWSIHESDHMTGSCETELVTCVYVLCHAHKWHHRPHVWIRHIWIRSHDRIMRHWARHLCGVSRVTQLRDSSSHNWETDPTQTTNLCDDTSLNCVTTAWGESSHNWETRVTQLSHNWGWDHMSHILTRTHLMTRIVRPLPPRTIETQLRVTSHVTHMSPVSMRLITPINKITGHTYA